MRILLLLPLLAACATTPPPCPPGSQAATRLEAYFGRDAGGAEVVDEAAWARFLDEVVTPAFPDGLTVLDGAGQWRGASGRIARERSKLLVVLAPGATPAAATARLAPVVAMFRARFAQESVMVTTSGACVRF
ncbi:DUF3574 domain-containing protein [Falsiroseomonas tokyonensis]|uniref:DUF3574 domain-containing protein n=1 Tax=Falsiroseomonas tokyonensis TaxID=430521 RepID=A0ABV7BV18_9PROT|nr:DUF3574 domain-containing protein [Falsiroseomonas tokyonensis]MBU8538473.1 DUF3574 domain-containing protein [Falsiroseomonas tokyonensis]